MMGDTDEAELDAELDAECDEWSGWLNVRPSAPQPRRCPSTPESIEFWRSVGAAADQVRQWPAWKRGEWRA